MEHIDKFLAWRRRNWYRWNLFTVYAAGIILGAMFIIPDTWSTGVSFLALILILFGRVAIPEGVV